jgi:hypothetical protein
LLDVPQSGVQQIGLPGGNWFSPVLSIGHLEMIAADQPGLEVNR